MFLQNTSISRIHVEHTYDTRTITRKNLTTCQQDVFETGL